MRRALLFVASAVEFDEYRTHLKSVSCPHCRAVGNLNRHGFLRGYAEEGSERVVRGWRIFCSNRGRRRGCGRTHSIFLADCLRRRMIRAGCLWKFLKSLGSGLCVKKAWEKLATGFNLKCGYRIALAMQRAHSKIRTLLCRVEAPPVVASNHPLEQTVCHLKAVFPDAVCPVRAFHLNFQQPFLG